MVRQIAAVAGLGVSLALTACSSMDNTPATPARADAVAHDTDFSLDRRPDFGEPASVVISPGTLTLRILTARDLASPAVIRVGDAIALPATLPLPEGQPSAGWTLHAIRVAQAGPFGRSGLCREGEASFVLQRKNEDGSLTLIGVTAAEPAAITAASMCRAYRFLA